MRDPLRDRLIADILGEDSIVLTEDQDAALQQFWHFYQSPADQATYLLTGSAGTGKTFMIHLFSQILQKSGYQVVLLAPTGRAAKVITRRTRKSAYTIHHYIYQVKEDLWGNPQFVLRQKKEKKKTVYIVDEASMIGTDRGEGGGNLLRDLLRFVFEEEEERKLILVGDPVQLPPVGYEDSPGLDPDVLTHTFHLNVFHTHLTEVKRQHDDSGILENAVIIRDAYLEAEGVVPALHPGSDVMIMDTPYEALETFTGYYQEGNPDRVVFITYSNYQAMKVNQAIRHELWNTEALLVPSEQIMVVKNNYAWGDEKQLPFIANGEMGTVRHVFEETRESLYGLQFVDAEIEFMDRLGEPFTLTCKLVLDLLATKHSQVPQEHLHQVSTARRAAYSHLSTREARDLMRKDPYAHALQIKYGYAITGHKAQGGQWENVVIAFEPDYGNDFRAYIRWAYTVLTRAEERVFLFNCPFLP